MQAVALRETQLQTLVDDLDGFVYSSALASAAWLAQIDGLIFPYRSVHGLCFLATKPLVYHGCYKNQPLLEACIRIAGIHGIRLAVLSSSYGLASCMRLVSDLGSS